MESIKRTFFAIVMIALLDIALGQTRSEPLSIFQQLNRKVQFKAFAITHGLEGKVVIAFEVDEMHLVKIRHISGSHPLLVEHVKTTLSNCELYGQSLLPGKSYFMTFSHFPPLTEELAPNKVKPLVISS